MDPMTPNASAANPMCSEIQLVLALKSLKSLWDPWRTE